jgi:hypothetical protein
MSVHSDGLPASQRWMIVCFASAALLCAASADAAPRRNHSKFLLYPNASATAGSPSLAGFDAAILQEYPSMRVGHIQTDQAQAFRKRMAEEGVEVQIRDNFDRIYLPGGVIDARLGTEESLHGRPLRAPYPGGRHGLYVIQFIGPPRTAWLETLANLGVAVIQPVPLNAALITADTGTIGRAAALPFVQFTDRYHPTLKAAALDGSPAAREFFVQLAPAPDVATDRTAVEAAATMLPRAVEKGDQYLWLQAHMTRAAVEGLLELPLVVGVFERPSFAPSDERVAMSLTRNVDVSGMPTHPTRYRNWLDRACPYCGNLAAENFKVGVADAAGIDGGTTGPHHPDLPASRVEYGTDFRAFGYEDPELRDFGGHSTMVAGIIAGNPSANGAAGAGGFLYGGGVAPSAAIVSTAVGMWQNEYEPNGQPSAANFTPIAETGADAREHGAYIQNHSYNRYTGRGGEMWPEGVRCPRLHDGEYEDTAAEFDQEVRQNHMTMVVSSGNIDGQARSDAGGWAEYFPNGGCTIAHPLLVLPPATAKNVISVGGAENAREPSEQWVCHGAGASSFSNVMANSKQGTRIAGYIKPDLMAPSSSITSIRSMLATSSSGFCNYASPDRDITLNSNQYIASTGTSWAAPVVAGAALLASRRYAESVRAPGAAPNASAARPSLLKAMLVAGARSMKGGIDKRTGEAIGALPNPQQGFGRVHLEDVLSHYPARTYLNETFLLSGSGAAPYRVTCRVHDPGLPVKVVLAWSDAAALPGTADGPTLLINDLDLKVELGSPCSTRYRGNRLDANELSIADATCTGGTPDDINNVELVRFNAGAPIDFVVEVSMTSGTNQHFALVIHNAYPAGSTPPPAPPSSLTATATRAGDGVWSASLSWPAVSGATSYEIFSSTGDAPFNVVATTGATGATIGGLTADTTYLYAVRARNSAGLSDAGPTDTATTVLLPDTIGAGSTTIRAEHFTSLRAAVNAVRQSAGLAQFSFADPVLATGAGSVRALHVRELRTALNEARLRLWLPLLTVTDPAVTEQATTIRAAHVNELRQGVQ